MSETTKRVLPAKVFDALEASAAEFGGIGAHFPRFGGEPWCVWGHAERLDRVGRTYDARGGLLRADILASRNDAAVVRINRRRWFGIGRFWFAKSSCVTFAEWCAELGVERGA